MLNFNALNCSVNDVKENILSYHDINTSVFVINAVLCNNKSILEKYVPRNKVHVINVEQCIDLLCSSFTFEQIYDHIFYKMINYLIKNKIIGITNCIFKWEKNELYFIYE